MNKEMDYMLRKIHQALEDYLYPICNKCGSKIIKRFCSHKQKEELAEKKS